MKQYLLLIAVILSQLTYSQSVEGLWKTVDEEGNEKSIIKIYKTNDNKLEGKVYKILNPERKDAVCENCKGDKKNKKIEGLVIIENMSFDDDQWEDGKITDPQNGKTYDCKIWIEKDEPNTLYVRGYIGFFYRTQKWIRAEN